MSIKTTIVDLQQYAAKKGWILISTTYKNNHTHMEWECENKHKWLAIWHNIKDKNQGCPVCNGKAKPEVKELQTHAISKGGKLISSTYINNRTLMEWQCSKGHVWKAAWAQIKSRGDWCPACAGKRTILANLQDYASSKGGKLLSTQYIKAKTIMSWECSNHHIWKSNWDNIKNKNNWCPSCSTLKTEKFVKQLLEQKLNIIFNKKQFHYDENNYRKYYELDGYNEEHKIGFEYNGEQHYIRKPHWQKTEQDFLALQERDKNKYKWCKDNKIILIIIPYTEKNNLDLFLTNICKKLKIIKKHSLIN